MRVFRYRFILLALIIIISATFQASAGDAPSDNIKKAARQGISDILKDRRNGGLHRLGFKSQTEIDSADLGDGFRIYTIHPKKILNESIPQDFQSLATPTNQWQFLVVVGIKAYALLTVDYVNGKWQPVSIGSSVLAKELSDIMQAWPASSGYQYRLIRVYQAKADFIELSQGGKVLGIISLTSLLTATGEANNAFNPRDLRDQNTILPSLRSVVKQHISTYRQ